MALEPKGRSLQTRRVLGYSVKTCMKKPHLRKLQREFFTRPTLEVARDLLGKLLIRQHGSGKLVGRIVETEAYRGEDDLACHASRGRTPRTDTLYARPGTAYVYMIYGMYHCLNVVTERAEFPAAVLIRSCVPLVDAPRGLIVPPAAMRGPGRLCRALHITRRENALDVTVGTRLCFADDGARVADHAVLRTPRIGVGYARQCAAWPWRFVVRGDESSGTSRRYSTSEYYPYGGAES